MDMQPRWDEFALSEHEIADATPPWRILVAVDGSEGSERALRWTARIACALRAEGVAIHVLTPVYSMAGWAGAVEVPTDESRLRDEVESTLELEWCDTLRAEGVKYRTMLKEGFSATAIMDAADEERADMIVVGARGRGGVAELLLGSVGHTLTHHAHRPVVVVRP